MSSALVRRMKKRIEEVSGKKPIKFRCCNSAIPGVHTAKCPNRGRNAKH